MKHLTVLTGASRGMGLAMAEQLCTPGARLLCLSRHTSDALAHTAQAHGTELLQWSLDLAEPQAPAQRLHAWLMGLDASAWHSATLINNAGVVGHLGPLDPAQAQVLTQTLRIDLEAPMQLTAAFLNATAHWQVPRKVLNISSGLGRRAMAGSAMYCAAKAGMDHFSRCVALDEARLTNGARVVSLAPGVIDTDMQSDLRAGDASGFPDREGFVQLKQTGALTSPHDAAARVLAYLQRADFGTQVVADVRDA